MKARTLGTLTIILAILLLIPAGQALAQDAPAEHEHAAAEGSTHAVAVLHATDGNSVSGVVHFVKTDAGIHITATLSGLEPGNHGFHVHQYGDCSAADGTSAGGHFNPAHVNHAGPDADVRHVGDLGNIVADESGAATYDRVDAHLTLEGPHSIMGRGLIVHAGEDDLTSQPTGAAGARVACGVIGVDAAE